MMLPLSAIAMLIFGAVVLYGGLLYFLSVSYTHLRAHET